MNATWKTFTLTTMLVAGAITIAGCTAGQTPTAHTPAPTVTHTASAQPADEQDTGEDASPPAVDAKAGDVIDADTAKALNEQYRNPADDRAYKMPDGEYLYVPAGQPLPKRVKDTVQAKVTAPAKALATANDADSRSAAITRSASMLASQAELTGRSFVPVVHQLSYDESLGKYAPAWTVGDPGPVGVYPSRTAAMTAAKEWESVSPNTREIIVIDAFK